MLTSGLKHFSASKHGTYLHPAIKGFLFCKRKYQNGLNTVGLTSPFHFQIVFICYYFNGFHTILYLSLFEIVKLKYLQIFNIFVDTFVLKRCITEVHVHRICQFIKVN